MTYWFYDLTRFVLWLMFRLGFGLDVRGQEHIPKRGAFIVASNHVSFLDPPLIGVACPRRLLFMARADLFRHPILGAFLRGVHVIPIVRGESDVSAIRVVVARLRQGQAIGIFPEGGRQPSGQLGTARRGVGLLAMMAQVPIIPAVVAGTYEALPREARRLHRSKIRVAFGPPIPYTDASPSSPSAVETGRSSGAPQERARRHHEALAEAVSAQWRHLAIRIAFANHTAASPHAHD